MCFVPVVRRFSFSVLSRSRGVSIGTNLLGLYAISMTELTASKDPWSTLDTRRPKSKPWEVNPGKYVGYLPRVSL